MLTDRKLDQITLYLDINLIRKYVEDGKLFKTTQDYCRFMFALGVMNVDKHDKMEKCFEILRKRKSNKDKEKPLNYHFGQFNKSQRIKDLTKYHFAYLGQEVEVFDCINLVIIKSELLLSEKNFSEHFWANNYIDLEKL